MQPATFSRQLKPIILPAVGFVMTSAQEHKLVAALSLLILAVYFPAASYLQRTYISNQPPPPPGAVRLFHNIEKISKDGIGFMELIRGYQPRADLRIYEDDRSLTRATGISEVDRLPGRFAEESGVGIALSATDGSNVKSNRYRYWIVKPEAARAASERTQAH